jgi:hypothetical protein
VGIKLYIKGGYSWVGNMSAYEPVGQRFGSRQSKCDFTIAVSYLNLALTKMFVSEEPLSWPIL